jgi:hypothetical protein
LNFARWHDCAMRDLAVQFLHLLATVARLVGPGGARSMVAESVLIKHQLLILNRSRKRSPNLRVSDRTVAGLCALLICPGRLILAAIVLKPSTLLNLHFLAHGPRSRERQSVESRSLSMRIGRPAYPLGARRDGPMDASYRGLWGAPRGGRWRGLVSNV